jgi:hypothetical protein
MLNAGKCMRDMDTRGDVSSMGKGLSSCKGYIEGTAWLMLRIVGEKGLITRKWEPTLGSTMQAG